MGHETSTWNSSGRWARSCLPGLEAPHGQSSRGKRFSVELTLDVDEAPSLHNFARELLLAHVFELAMGNRGHHRLGGRQVFPGDQFEPVLMARLLGVGHR